MYVTRLVAEIPIRGLPFSLVLGEGGRSFLPIEYNGR